MTLTPTTRASLLLRLRDPRDHEAWVEFVSLYEPVIYRVLRRTGLQDADALEMSQELFLAVNRNIGRWEPGAEHGSFRGWLRRVTRNLVVSWVRRQKRQVTSSSLDLDELLESPPAVDGLETGELDRELRRALFHLASERVRAEVRPQTWQAFWEVAVSGTSVAEVAIRLGMTAGAVRVAKCRIIARLRELVAEMEKGT
ncbi:MAG: RNA polymerase sigma factor [Planctomycetales bacterium]